MSAVSAAGRAQRLAESIMIDSCTITRPDPSNFTGDPITVYSGSCRVRALGHVSGTETGGADLPNDRHRYRIDIPVAATGVEFQDLVLITASSNPSMVGRDGLVTDIFTQSLASAQRLSIEKTLK